MQTKVCSKDILDLTKGKDVVLVSYNSWQDNNVVSDFIDSLSNSSNLRHITHSSLQIELSTIQKYLITIGTNFDYIISIGGGCVIDLAKILRATRSIDIENMKLISYESSIVHIAVPTTVGSGSEATTFATYYGNQKESFSNSDNLPKYFCHEPEFIKTLTDDALYSSVLDGMTQAIESLFSKNANNVSIEYSKESIKGYLESKVFNTRNYNIELLQLASHNAGKAINIAKTNIAHAISYHLTKHHQVPHGRAVFLSLPGLLKIVESASHKSERLRHSVKILLELFEVDTITKVINLFDYVQNINKISKINNIINKDTFISYFKIAKESSRGLNLDIDLADYTQDQIVELFYD